MGEPPCGKPCETASLVSKRLHILAEIGYHRIVNPSELLEFSADRTSPVHLERISYERNTPAQHHRPHRSVDEKTILHGIDLDVAAGETHVLMGPNGAGKSTMGHVIMGDPVYTVNEGTITFDGQDITDLSPDKRSRAGLFLSFQAPVEIPGVPLSSFLRASIAGAPASR